MIEFKEILKDGYPKEEGKYLVAYFDHMNGNLPDYAILFYKSYIENDETKMAFFYGETCSPGNRFEGPMFNNHVFKYCKLPEF